MKIQPPDSEEFAKTWYEKPDIIRAFIEVRPRYEQLCSEVEYILKKRLDEMGVEYSAIISRAKSLKSFAEKLTRKNYNDPFNDVTDLAGVRVVYLYKADRNIIEKVIESEFTVIEKIDKVEEQEPDRFGYGALHYLVNIGRKSSGARYDDLKGLMCEIQVRTVLQDAWAIINHHLSYKQDADVPKVLKRKLSSISGLLETADDQFERIRIERGEYRKNIKSKLSDESSFLDQEINLDTFTEFLKWQFPRKKIANDDAHLSRILSRVTNNGYSKLSDLDELLKRTEKARKAMESESPLEYGVAEVFRALAFLQPSNKREEFYPRGDVRLQLST